MTVGIDGPKLNMGRFVQDRMLNLRPCTVKDNVDLVLGPRILPRIFEFRNLSLSADDYGKGNKL